ncbi:MAG: hypothetical protein EU532_08220 [Promethearchaeota archaeon]|nr:MAG: hypothetical protein EU532_08220 [Candidatus Lokiarchaeota archaeon]
MKTNNILSGIIISDLISFISYFIIPSGLIFLGDFHILIGVLWGTYFAVKYLKKKQNYFKNGLKIGLISSYISALSIFFFELPFILSSYTFSIDLVIILLSFFSIEAIIIGIIVGLIIGYYFYTKEGGDKEHQKNKTESEFYNSLKDKY